MTYENPPRNEEEVETFEDERQLTKVSTAESKIEEIIERSAETPLGISESDKEKIADLKKSIETTKSSEKLDVLINNALNQKDDGTEDFVDTRLPEEKQQPEKKSRKVTGLRKIAMALGFMFAGLTGQAKDKTPEGNFSDSTRNNIEKSIENSEKVSDKLRRDWNDYVDWLETQNMKGNAELDHNDMAGKMIDKYRSINPETSVSRETVDDIQAEFAKYKDWVVEEIKAGRAHLKEGTTLEDFMKNLSKIDNIAGQLTTKKKFPDTYLKTFVGGKLQKTENLGFAKTAKDSTTAIYNAMAKNK